VVALASLWVLGASTSPVRATQGQTPTFRSGLTVVPLDVRVVDRKGAIINDLTKDDFVVSEDGVQQDITHFERHVLTAGEPGSVPARSTLAPFALEGRNRRVFYLELGRLWLSDLRFGLKEALTTFLRERLLPQDYVVLASFGRMTDLTTDHEAVAQVIERLAALHAQIDRITDVRDRLMATAPRWLPADHPVRHAYDEAFAPASSSLRLALRPAAEFAAQLDRLESGFLAQAARRRTAPPLGARSVASLLRSDMLLLLGALQYLRFLDGEKHLVYFPADAQGFMAVETDRDITRVANDARVALHTIRGIGGLGTSAGFTSLLGDMAAQNISRWTGGSVYLNRWPHEAFAKIDELTRGGYLLAYSPKKATANERHRKITVRVKRPNGARVMVRDSYLSTNTPVVYEPSTYLAKQQMLTVAEFPGGIDDIGVEVTASSKPPATITATIEIDLSRVTFAAEGDRHVAKLEVAVFCSGSRDQFAGQKWDTLDLNLKNDMLTGALKDGLTHVVTVPVSTRVRTVKAVVFDYATSRAGAGVVQIR
jgi:VWFA-related protein